MANALCWVSVQGSCPKAKAPLYGWAHEDPGGLVTSTPSTLSLCPELVGPSPWMALPTSSPSVRNSSSEARLSVTYTGRPGGQARPP